MYSFKIRTVENLFDYKKFLKITGFQQSQIDDVRNNVKNYKEVPRFLMNEQILTFLTGCNGDIDKTTQRIRLYYKCKRDIPEFFRGRNPNNDEIKHCFDNQYYVTLPVLNNSNIMFTCLSNYEAKNYIFDHACKTFIMICEGYLFENGPRNQTIFLFDMIGAKLSHAFQPRISSIRKGMHFLENATPLNIKEIHIINAPSFVEYIFSIVKPFASIGILSKVYLHTSNINWQDFFQNHIPKSHLPSDYGGELKSIKELHEEQREKMFEIKDYFEFEEMQVDYTFDKLLGDLSKDIDWQDSSFKKSKDL
ncbi:hypothetical protein PVAND_009122 [Polypedilum vanderplanki]|uniref:CRAL-TRIO domain-containing protein n=1 Tax=Polypedilum vanderplanki TaxID=319348 RepID=A0A9J6CBY1_POLVA|nr:hypothetical protein PVAND_009122 [Polypedilum vanderplanki]